MAVLITMATSAAKMDMSHKTGYSTYRVAGDSAVMVIASKRREEVRTVDTGRRASVHWEQDQAACKERRGSKASSRRQSVAKGDTSDSKMRHGSLDRKKEVLVTRDR